MIVRNNRIVLAAFLSLIMGFAAAVFTGCPSVDDDDDSAAEDDDSAGDDDDSAE